MKTEKAEISKAFSRLRQYGYDVINLNDNRRGRSGARGLMDYHIISDKYYIIVSVKLDSTKDKLSELDKKMYEKFKNLMSHNRCFHFSEIRSIKQAEDYRDYLLTLLRS